MSNPTHTTMILDEHGIEMIAAWSKTREGMELKTVEVVICGKGIDITDKLDQKQYDHVCEEITLNL